MFDVSTLPVTSAKKDFPWRKTRVALILIREDGVVERAGVMTQKADLLRRSAPNDCVLAIRMLQNSPDVLFVDNRDEALNVLSA